MPFSLLNPSSASAGLKHLLLIILVYIILLLLLNPSSASAGLKRYLMSGVIYDNFPF